MNFIFHIRTFNCEHKIVNDKDFFYRIFFETEFKKNVVFLVFWMDVVPKLKFVLFDNYRVS